MRRDIVFVHIPKTAGTSLRVALEREAGGRVVLRHYDPASPTTTEALSRLVHENRLRDFRRQFDREDRGIFLSGHFPARRYWKFFHAESFMTFIRHPVDRVLSEFNNFVTKRSWKAPLEEFVSSVRFRNTMTRALDRVDLEAFGFIGITEEFDRSIEQLRDFLGMQIPSLNVNQGKYEQDGGGAEIRSRGDVRAMIADLNRDDIDLYERLVKLRARAGRAYDSQAAPARGYRGAVNVERDAAIAGWVCNAAREFICEVEIFEGGRLLGRVKADRYRAGIKQKGISRSGVCGFRVDRQWLLKMGANMQGTLRFKVRGTDYELRGSPLSLSPKDLAASP